MSQQSSGAVRILAVFADTEDRDSLSQLFHDFRWKSRFVDGSCDVEGAFHDFQPDVVMTDAALPGGKCWKDVLRSAQDRSDNLPVIVGSRLADEKLWAEVLNLGGYDLLVKPFVAAEVQSVVCMACRSYHIQEEQIKPAFLVKRAG